MHGSASKIELGSAVVCPEGQEVGFIGKSKNIDLNESWITALELFNGAYQVGLLNNQRPIFEPVSHMLFGQVTAGLV
jgi:hypothetical protein